MKTEFLNEYIFAQIVTDVAQHVRRLRLKKMRDDGVDEEEIFSTPITTEDLRKGFEIVEWQRREVSVLLRELYPDSAGSPQDGH